MQSIKYKVQNAKYKIEIAIATTIVNIIPFYIYLLTFLYLFSLFF